MRKLFTIVFLLLCFNLHSQTKEEIIQKQIDRKYKLCEAVCNLAIRYVIADMQREADSTGIPCQRLHIELDSLKVELVKEQQRKESESILNDPDEYDSRIDKSDSMLFTLKNLTLSIGEIDTALDIHFANAYKDIYDTIPVMILYSDTCHLLFTYHDSIDSIVYENGREVNYIKGYKLEDTVADVKLNYQPDVMFCYSVRKYVDYIRYLQPMQTIDGFEILERNFEHVYYLDKFKNPLSNQIVVWQSIPVRKENNTTQNSFYGTGSSN